MNESQLVENFFRHQSARLVALLTRAFGIALMDVVEDMVQEAMLEALRNWRINGVPDNPEAWFHRVARNRVIDSLRRERKHVQHDHCFDSITSRSMPPIVFDDQAIEDSQLRLIFACCHPSLDRPSQLALTLKLLCGLGDQEIARGLLISHAAAKKRITRAKQYLQLNGVSLELPPTDELTERLENAHDVLYLMFNEGYHATRGSLPVRIDLCEDAARLVHLLCESSVATPATEALLALMLYHAARLESRIDGDNEVVLLADQDRSRWDRDMMAVADYWLAKSTHGSEISRFHLEAGIARLHAHSPSLDQTDWEAIVAHYDLIQSRFPSPLVVLNRAIALGRLGRDKECLESLRAIEGEPEMSRYPLLKCSLAETLVRLHRFNEAIEHWEAALPDLLTDHDRRLVGRRIQETRAALDSDPC